ncbi:hotdog fold thioesterase [Pseudomonas sp. NPDC007930]|uniref:PaaI family thioesterase n=1 Tax=Pseudomonas sp. NPDC007930 TaxID=3364417 RepID=UPI0036EA1E66
MPAADTLAQWLEDERQARQRLGAPGVVPADAALQMSPVQFFQGIADGELPCPPIGVLMDFVPIGWGEGEFTFQGTPDERHHNPMGGTHGGYAATLLDSCMGCAIHTHLAQGQGYTTLDLRVSYVRGLASAKGPVRAIGTVVHVGRSTALAEGRIVDAEGRLYATGTTTCLILTPKGSS